MRTLARIPPWNWRMTSIITDGTPARASTFHNSSRSTESYAFWRSTKHMYSGIFLCRPSSWSRRTTNSMSMMDRAGRKPHCSSGSICYLVDAVDEFPDHALPEESRLQLTSVEWPGLRCLPYTAVVGKSSPRIHGGKHHVVVRVLFDRPIWLRVYFYVVYSRGRCAWCVRM